MIRKVLLIFLLALPTLAYSQSNLYSDSLDISDSTILIATSTQNKQYEFCIKGKSKVVDRLKQFTYGPAQDISLDRNSVAIKLVTKGKIAMLWNAHPRASVIEVGGKRYRFDATILSVLHKQYPINYWIEEKIFASRSGLDNYYQGLLRDKSFLYIVPHNFEEEWYEEFNLTFKKDSKFSSPKAIADYLDTVLIKILQKGRYSVSYSPFESGTLASANEITMTIYSKDALYERFNDPHARKSGLALYPTYIIRKK